MRKITKSSEPDELKKWKKHNSNQKNVKTHTYANLEPDVRKALRKQNIHDQRGLCAYCCTSIDMKNSMNEHVEAKHLAPKRELDFSNIVASCTTAKQCDKAHGSQELLLTPLMDACETELQFYGSGNVKGLTDRATEAIEVLKLNKKGLKGCRKQVIDAFFYFRTYDPDELHLLESDDINSFIKSLQAKDEQGLLQPYSPVLINILKSISDKEPLL